jgi:hypothetical protein
VLLYLKSCFIKNSISDSFKNSLSHLLLTIRLENLRAISAFLSFYLIYINQSCIIKKIIFISERREDDMKAKFIVLFFVSILFLEPLYAQDTIKTFYINFKGKTISNFNCLDNIKKGDLYRIQIDGINQFLYNIKIAVNDTILQSGALAVPTLTGFNTSVISSLVSQLGSGGLISYAVTKTTTSSKEVKENAASKDKTNENLTKGFKPNISLRHTIKKVTSVIKTKIYITDSLILNNKKLLHDYDDSLYSYKTKYEEHILNYNRYLLRAFIADSGSKLYNQFNMNDAVENAYIDFNNIRQRLHILYDSSSNHYNNYIKEIAKYDKIIAGKDSLKNDDKNIKDCYTGLMLAIKNYENIVSPDSIFKYMKELINTENNSSFTYLTMPMQFSKDRTDVAISIIPKGNDYGLQTYSMKLTFPMNKLFYAGISTGFYGTTLHDEAFSSKKIISQGDTSYSIVKENSGNCEIGLCSMVKIGYYIHKILNQDVSLQFGFGPGISIQNKMKPRFLLGGGLAIGSSNMLLFSLGAIIGSVDVLSSVYDQNQTYSSVQQGVTSGCTLTKLYWSLEYLFDL